ncbi:MAG: cytochrome c oxidase subunit II [Methylococcales bacterium]|nr:cytochrome c oxidase subunit II [Methylococcales bacterium]MBT7445790.1 cytochrome c oxidase subunit II [Methylococcales bacterium]
MKRLLSFAALIGLVISTPVLAEYGLNFPEPATPVATEIKDIHNLTMIISTVLLVIVFTIVFYSLFTHRKSRGFEPDQEFHKGTFGKWSWVLVPVTVLGVDLTIADSAQSVLEKVWIAPNEEMIEIKVVGHQWWWEFVYLTEGGVKVESRILSKKDLADRGQPENLYLRAVDNHLKLPVGKNVKFLHTSDDVLHAFWVPALGMKKDAIPGYIQETWIDGIYKEGIYRGQCAEMCGTKHAFMPIVVEAVSEQAFATWIAEKKVARDKAIAEANSNKTWTKDELMAKGKTSYDKKCAACHKVDGSGGGPFPKLAGSPMATTGSIADHMNIVLKGKGVMPAWASSMDDLELAAVVTYERNAWGNDTGDVIQPKDVKASR